MAKKKIEEEYIDQAGYSGVPMKILSAILAFGVAALIIYISFAAPQAGTAMESIRGVTRGLAGSMSIVLSLECIWAGVLCIFSARGKHVKWWRVVMNAALFLCVYTAVHLFSSEMVIDSLTLKNYSSFIAASYYVGAGGGAIGAIAAYPLYVNLGAAGGLIVVIIFAVLMLTANGYTQRFIRFLRRRAKADAERRNEHMFEQEHMQPRAPQRREMENRNRARRMDDDYMQIDTPVRAPRRKYASEAARNGNVKKMYNETINKTNMPRPADTDTIVPKSLQKNRREHEIERKAEEAYSRAVENYNRKKAAEGAQEAPIDPDALFDVQDTADNDIDDFASNPAAQRSAGRKSAEKPAEKKADKPKQPRATAKKTVVEGVRPLGVDDGDKTIVPDHYENDDADDAPFAPLKKPARRIVDESDDDFYNYPPIDLLEAGDRETDSRAHKDVDRQKADLLISTLQSFGVETRLIGIAHGPAVTRFELQPAPGIKVNRITSLADNIALVLAALSVRIEAPIPGKAAVGIEIPNDHVEMVRLRDVLESPEARRHPSKLAVGLGKDNSGRYIVADIAKMPHVLIAGQTGSGKSVCINSIISSILYRATPDEVRMILIDPKVVELSIYNDIPHLIAPVVTDPKKAASALNWAVVEMKRRYDEFAKRGVRDIKGYNKALEPGEKIMPQFVIIIDELADLMMVAPGEVEDSICRLAQLARAAGMHLVIATQRPSVNVITGIIKANIPTRIAFSVASQIDSRTMIDHGGAEKLLGNGDMLFVQNGTNKALRVQGAWISDDEVHAIVSYIKERSQATYDEDVVERIENSEKSDAEKEDEAENDCDSRLAEAVEIVVDMGQASVSMLQRRMRVGYARAGRLIDEMEKRGIVSEADGAKPRTVLINREQYRNMFGEE